jgi:tetratricopeptide (TPR) repeat protein
MIKNKDGDYKEAIEDCSKAIVFCTLVLADYYLKRAYAFWLNSQYDRAIDDCKKALDNKPNTQERSFAHELLGNIYSHLGDDREAIEQYGLAMDLTGQPCSPGLLDKYREARRKVSAN